MLLARVKPTELHGASRWGGSPAPSPPSGSCSVPDNSKVDSGFFRHRRVGLQCTWLLGIVGHTWCALVLQSSYCRTITTYSNARSNPTIAPSTQWREMGGRYKPAGLVNDVRPSLRVELGGHCAGV